MPSYIHYVTDQDEYDTMITAVYDSKPGSHHLICIYAHGNAENDELLTTIDPHASTRCIFIKDNNHSYYDFNHVIETAFKNNKFVYILSISCFWNEKYKKGLTIPTISLAPDEASYLPYPFVNLKRRINSLPDDFDEEIMINWFQQFKKNLNLLMNCWEHIEENGKERKAGGYILKYNDHMLQDDCNWNSRTDENLRNLEKKRKISN